MKKLRSQLKASRGQKRKRFTRRAEHDAARVASHNPELEAASRAEEQAAIKFLHAYSLKMHSVDSKPERRAELFAAADKAEQDLIEAKGRVRAIKEKSGESVEQSIEPRFVRK